MAEVEYNLDENVAVMTWNSGENRFNPTFLEAILEAMNDIEANTEATVLVVKSAHEKIWSNGLDLDWLMPVMTSGDEKVAKAFFYQFDDFLRRLMTSPMLTVAAITGHAAAAGAIAACAFDFRFMRTGRGYFFFPEVDLGMPFLPGMLALTRSAMPSRIFREMYLTGRRLTAEQCVEAGVMLGAYNIDELMDQTIAWAKIQNKRRETVKAMKKMLYAETLRVMDKEDSRRIETSHLRV